MQDGTAHASGDARALRAAEAGLYLAKLVGLAAPIPATKMWRLGRSNLIRTVRLGRLCYFRTSDLEQFVADGGCGRRSGRVS